MEFLGGVIRYCNTGEYKPCKGNSIGELIEYLEQFPQDWRISVGGKSEPVIGMNAIWTELTSIGDDLEI